ncbi:MAG: PHP domain-containing protein [Candidatus Ozemobacteraceae bacterium]
MKKKTSPTFVHLHVHRQYSILNGIGSVRKIVEKAREYNMLAVTLTDHGNLFWAMEFYQRAHQAHLR